VPDAELGAEPCEYTEGTDSTENRSSIGLGTSPAVSGVTDPDPTGGPADVGVPASVFDSCDPPDVFCAPSSFRSVKLVFVCALKDRIGFLAGIGGLGRL
jgi:hypothetical protein